jgi:hypothetical protein
VLWTGERLRGYKRHAIVSTLDLSDLSGTITTQTVDVGKQYTVAGFPFTPKQFRLNSAYTTEQPAEQPGDQAKQTVQQIHHVSHSAQEV